MKHLGLRAVGGSASVAKRLHRGNICSTKLGMHFSTRSLSASFAVVLCLACPRLTHAVPVTVPNYSFEIGNNPPAESPITPNGANTEQVAGMMTETPNAPQGWTFTFEQSQGTTGTINNKEGVAIPAEGHYGSKPGFNGVTSLPAPFDGNQYLFVNLDFDAASGPNGLPSVARLDSGTIGILQAGTYTLTLAVGGRNTGSWRNIDYSLGLATIGATPTELGTFAHPNHRSG
jgi:hypothetical protein